MNSKIYLASPYGFSRQQEERLLPTFVDILSELGADVWEPFARNRLYGSVDEIRSPNRALARWLIGTFD